MKNILKSYNMFTIIFAIIIVLTVVCTPIYGLGDLSEYLSVFENIGLFNTSADTSCITQSYGISDNGAGAVNFFEKFLSGVVAVNKALFSKTVFNIHFLSSIYVIVFLISVYFLQKNLKCEINYLNYVFSALLTIVFADIGYLAYFNSFYADGLLFAVVFAFFSILVSLIRKFSYLKLALLLFAICVFSMTKISAAPVALFMALAGAIVGFGLKGGKRAATVACSVLVAIVAIFSLFTTQISARDTKLYNIVYNDLAQNTDSDLSALNIKLIDIPAENMNSDGMKSAIDGITYADVAKYYVSNPSVFYDSLKSAANNAYFLVLDFAPYREAGATYGIREITPLKIWNYLKRRILPVGLIVILAFVGIYFAVAIREFLKYKKVGDSKKGALSLLSASLPVGALSEMVATVLTTGRILVSKNMFAFGIYFDLMIVTAVIWISATLLERRRAITEKYGVNQ